MNPELRIQLQERIKQMESISTAPAILKPLLEMLRLPSEKIRIDKVVELVSYDGSIAAQCLRLANSPLFGRRPIETVRSAVMTLGLEKIRSILIGLCVNRVVPNSKWVIEPDAFWRHSLGCALATQKMAQKIEYPDPEKAYLAGLLHDVGFLVNSVLYTQQFRECLGQATELHLPLNVIEEQILGFNHCDTGQLLCEHWGLPEELVEAAAYHHDAALLPTAGPLVCLVHLSDLLCRMRCLGYGYDEIVGIDLGNDVAWQTLAVAYPALSAMDLACFTLDLEGDMEQIVAVVDAVFVDKAGGRALAARV